MANDEGAHSDNLAVLPNLRDIGGAHAGNNWRVRPSIVYRSIELHRLPADDHKFGLLGIKTIYDLRTAAERIAAPDPQLDGVSSCALDVLADSATALPANLATAIDDQGTIPRIGEALGGGRAGEMMVDTYRQIISLPSALASYRSLFEGLAGGYPSPSLFHCTTGKDRTGWAAAALLSILGVDRSEVYRDYLLTNDQLIPALHPVFAKFEAAGGDPDVLRHVLGVDRSYLDAAFDEMDKRYGNIEGYFVDGLKLEEHAITALKEQLLEPR